MNIDWYGFVTCVFSMLAALFWLWSATTVLPKLNANVTEQPGLDTITKQSRWNALAAVCAAIASVCQALAFLGTLPRPGSS